MTAAFFYVIGSIIWTFLLLAELWVRGGPPPPTTGLVSSTVFSLFSTFIMVGPALALAGFLMVLLRRVLRARPPVLIGLVAATGALSTVGFIVGINLVAGSFGGFNADLALHGLRSAVVASVCCLITLRWR